MKVRSLAIAVVGALALIVIPSSSQGANHSVPTPEPVLTALSPETDKVLWELAGTQTETEIEAIIDSGLPVADLFDPITEEVIAAVQIAPPSPLSRAITWTSPGCGIGSACITSAGIPFGYTGSGALAGPWSKVSKVAAGNRNSTFWVSQTSGYALGAIGARTFTSTVNLVSLTRS